MGLKFDCVLECVVVYDWLKSDQNGIEIKK